ncbi:MAG: glycosyltransferase, partial [Peptococcaceae bacterium]|nr:glycosyltransferase [Peptococcaceae bacterium]
ALEFHGSVNFMKAALLHADRITTVSPTYAEEIKNPYYGERLDGLLRKRSEVLTGILNGINYEVYDPSKDSFLDMPLDNLSHMKKENKKHLQTILELPILGEKAVLGMVTQLADQKGIDLLVHVMEDILVQEVQMVIVGTGEIRYKEMLCYFASKYPEKLAIRLEFSNKLAHELYAGADIFLMPSRFEPCGTAQMIAMRYGTIPVVRETGGLKDTVMPYNEMTGAGNGFSFANYNAHEFLYAVQRALSLYQSDKQVWYDLGKKAFESDFSWERSANAYLELYELLL